MKTVSASSSVSDWIRRDRVQWNIYSFQGYRVGHVAESDTLETVLVVGRVLFTSFGEFFYSFDNLYFHLKPIGCCFHSKRKFAICFIYLLISSQSFSIIINCNAQSNLNKNLTLKTIYFPSLLIQCQYSSHCKTQRKKHTHHLNCWLIIMIIWYHITIIKWDVLQ